MPRYCTRELTRQSDCPHFKRAPEDPELRIFGISGRKTFKVLGLMISGSRVDMFRDSQQDPAVLNAKPYICLMDTPAYS